MIPTHSIVIGVLIMEIYGIIIGTFSEGKQNFIHTKAEERIERIYNYKWRYDHITYIR